MVPIARSRDVCGHLRQLARCDRDLRQRPALPKAEDAGLFDFGIFKFTRHRHRIFDHGFEPVERKIGAARVADEHGRPAAREPAQPFRRLLGDVSFVGDVPRQDDLPALVGADQIFETGRDRDAVLSGVGFDRRDRESVDVAGLDRRRAAQRGGDRDKPGTGGEIERALAREPAQDCRGRSARAPDRPPRRRPRTAAAAPWRRAPPRSFARAARLRPRAKA